MGLRQERSQDFSRVGEGGVHTVPKRGFSPEFISFLSPVVGCLLKTWLTKGGHGAPQDPPGYAPGLRA